MEEIGSLLRVKNNTHFEYDYLKATEKEEVKAVFYQSQPCLENILGDKWSASCCLDHSMLWEGE